VNLVVVGGVIDPEDTGDREERAECEKMHNLVKEYKLHVRGLGGTTAREACGCGPYSHPFIPLYS